MTDRPGATLRRRAVDASLQTQHAVDSARASGRGTLRAERLPRLLHEAPAACLLVDVTTREVVQANAAGRALAAQQPLPASAATWTAAAGLRQPDGSDFAPGSSPLERAAAGEQTLGEPVVVPQAGGDRMLWVTGFPVPSDGGHAQSLVVFFEIEGADAAAGLEIRDRAVVAAGLSFTITDPRRDDDPLVFVNPAFERTTGYPAEEAVGRNCRFLQGPETDPRAVAEIRRLLDAQEHGTVTLLNYRKDGTAFWNELSLSPVYDGEGQLTHVVGIQADVTARVLAEHERERHLAAEQLARAEAERAQRRLALLAEATSMLAATLDVDDSLDRLARLPVPLMADWCTVHLLAEDGTVQRVAAVHSDPAKHELLRRLEQLQPQGLSELSETAQVLRGGPPVLLPHVTREQLENAVADPELREVYRAIGLESVIIVPMRARQDQVLGALALFTDGSGRRFDEEDLSTAADLARRAALTVDNARLYQREHDVAEALQRSLLPQLPALDGLDSASVYLPGSAAAQVGGDWYDLFRLPDGAVGLAVGDVMGHDLTAAAAMGQLRSVLQSYAWQGSGPAVVLDRLDQLVQGLDMAQLATCVYGRLEDAGDGARTLRLANAGHLPPLVRTPDGQVRLLTEGVSLLVGAALGIERDELVEHLPAGSSLVLYTDGLVEHRGRDLTDGLQALEAAVAGAPAGTAQELLDHLLAELVQGGLEDDVAVLVVRLAP